MGKITIEAYTLVISNKSGILQMELLNYFSQITSVKEMLQRDFILKFQNEKNHQFVTKMQKL